MGLDLKAELTFQSLFDGREHAPQEWFLTALSTLRTFPCERYLRRTAVGVLRVSGERWKEQLRKQEAGHEG